MINFLKLDLQKIFDQYLRTTKIPTLQYQIKGKQLKFRWVNCVKGFNMSLKVKTRKTEEWIKPTDQWQTVIIENLDEKFFEPNKNFYILTR